MGATSSPQESSPGGVWDDIVLRTEGLTKRFGQRAAVSGVSLEVHRGDVFGLLGPNGSGKTTTLRMVLGLVWPTAGEIRLFGRSLRMSAERRSALQRVGAIVESPSFYPFLSARENLRGVASFAGLPNSAATRARIEEVLAQVGLATRARDAYKKYSLGMKQRLAIAAALLTRPELIVLDEPTNGLDPAGVVEVRSLITELARRGTTVVLSSHLLFEVQQVCTRVAILKDGQLLRQGAVSELLVSGEGIVLGFADPALLPQAVNVLREADPQTPWLHGAEYIIPEPGTWTPPGGWLLLVHAPATQAADLNALLASHGIYAAEVRRREASLEQFFLALTSGNAVVPPVASPTAIASASMPSAQSYGTPGGHS